jgi:AMMECR1 domain-containing protein
VLKQGSRQAVFLPQVAPEQGWDLDETLRQLSRKAGLPPQAWKDPETTYDVFTAEIIEQEPR